MFLKLLKYELKSILKFLVIFYSLALFFSILTRIFFSIEGSLVMDIIAQVCSGITVSMMFSTVINNLIRLWGRFGQNFYGDESYLTHTLPVKKFTHYTAKLATAVITLFVSVAVIGVSLFIAYYSDKNMELLRAFILPVATAYESSVATVLTVILFVLFLEFANTLQCGYTGIILGHRMNGGKIGFSVLFGFAVNMASQLIVLIAIAVAGLFSPDLMNLIFTNEAVNAGTVKIVIHLAMAVYSAVIVLGYAVNVKLFGRGVDVE